MLKVVKVETEEKANLLMGCLEELGFLWASHEMPTEYGFWNTYESDSTVWVDEDEKEITFGNSVFYEEEGEDFEFVDVEYFKKK